MHFIISLYTVMLKINIILAPIFILLNEISLKIKKWKMRKQYLQQQEYFRQQRYYQQYYKQPQNISPTSQTPVQNITDYNTAPDNRTPPTDPLARFKGIMGEHNVNKLLLELDRERYILLSDILLKADKYGSSYTTQIDHILVSVYGIFVIETKNYSGKIYGTDRSDNWREYLRGEEFKFYNPVKQNYAHKRALEDLLGQTVIPIVVFSDNALIKAVTSHTVINMSVLKETIRSYDREIYSREQINGFARKISENNITSPVSRAEHISQVRQSANKYS